MARKDIFRMTQKELKRVRGEGSKGKRFNPVRDKSLTGLIENNKRKNLLFLIFYLILSQDSGLKTPKISTKRKRETTNNK